MEPTLFVILGHVGAGKTTVANMLAEKLKIPVASVDATVKRLFDEPTFLKDDVPISPHERMVFYNASAVLTDYIMGLGHSIIIDGVFAHQSQRDHVISQAKKHKARFFVIEVTCPDEIIKERTKKRYEKGKGVGFEGHKEIKRIFEPVDMNQFVIDSSKDVKKQLGELLAKI
ncbi:AAA family ATPase [Nanoarchaeota archaeon]